MSKKQLSVRVPEDVFTHIVRTETMSGKKRTDVVTDILRKGIANDLPQSYSNDEEMTSARIMAEEQLEYKKKAIEYKKKYESARESMRILQHPLFDEIQTEGIKVNGNVFKTINQLFDYLNDNLK